MTLLCIVKRRQEQDEVQVREKDRKEGDVIERDKESGGDSRTMVSDLKLSCLL